MAKGFSDFRRRGASLTFLIVAASFSLVGCAASLIHVPPATPRSDFASSQKLSTVVIGQIYAGSGSADASCPYTMMTDWVQRVLPGETPDMTAPRQFQINRTACSVADRAAPPNFTTFQLTPGTYTLFRITRHNPFTPTSVTEVRNTAAAAVSADKLTVPRFSVAAGEVVYVGNVVFLNSFPAEMRGAVTPEPARAALRELWPDGAARMIERRMIIGPLNPK